MTAGGRCPTDNDNDHCAPHNHHEIQMHEALDLHFGGLVM